MAADGTYTYVAGSSAGTDSFNYTVTDEFGATDIATLTITVNSSNAAPTASNSTVHINENNQVSTAGDRTPLNITKVFAPGDFNFSDTDGDSLSKVKITTLESAGTLEYYNGSSWTDVTEDQEITAANITSGYLRFTPALNSEDDVTFSFKVHDGTEYSSSAYTMTISVNAAPYVTNVTHSGNVAAGATTSSADIHGVINGTDAVADSDDDDSVLVVTGVAAGNESTNNTIITDDTGVGGDGIDGTYGTLTVAADGTYTYTASATNSIAYDATDTDTFTFTTRDDEGSSGNAGSHAYDVGTITFTVASSISLTNDNDTATEGTAITVTGAQDDVLNDDTADTDGLVVTNISHDNGSESVSSGTTYANGASLAGDYGTLVIGADGSYTFTPNDVLGASETGTDVFTYTADGATATLSIEVTGINDAPTALDNSITTNEDTNHVFSTGEFNFSDDDNSGSLNKIKITSLEDNGALQYYNGSTWVDVTENQEITAADITSGYLRFKPDANENGDDYTSFEFQVSDGTAYSSSSSTMTINVTPVNDAPVAANNTGTILEDGTLTVNDGDGANSSGGVTDDGQTADISNEETSVSGLSFNNDGTKMFVSGGQSDTVHEYSLSTAFDVSTKSATANESYSDASNYDWTRGHTWNADGTKLFIIDNDEGESWQKILEHTVQTAFDLSSTVTRTNTYDLVAPSGGSIPTRPKGITFNSDGTKMYIADHATDKIHQFTLSVGFDLTSTVANSGTLDVSSQNDSPYGVEFSQDGSKVFVVGNGTQGDAVYQYTLNTAWDITSTATYNDSFNLSSQDSVPADIRFNNDGTKMFIAGSNGNEIDEYTLSTPFEIASISGDHDGDVLVDDTDADSGDTLTVTTYSHTSATDEDGGSISSTSSTGTAGTNNVTGYYGTLDLEGDGSYTYTADLTATQALDPGDTVTDVFTYTVDDGNGETDTATITITVIGVNDTPTASNGTVNINENNQASTAGDRTPSNITKVFAASDFNFADDDTSGSLSKVKITTLESAGDLEYNNGSSWVDVTENQEITASDISNNKLRFTPAANSESNPTFGFKVHDGTDYSSSAYTMTISVNAAPDVTNATVGSTVAAGATSSGDVHDGVADSDDDNSVLVVTGVASGNESSNNTIITNNTGVGSAVSGTYGSLTVAADGTYTYTASATNNIAYNSTATDTFTFTTRDDETASGSFAYDVGSITFTVASSISLVVDTDAVAEDGTVTHLTNSEGTVISNDAADTNGLVVTNISHSNGNADTIESGSTYTDSGGEPGSVVGTYGQLTIAADGSYSYVANQDLADALDVGDSVTDTFNYTLSDGTATNIGVITITILGANDNPTAVNDTGYIKEGGTLTVANSAAASSGTSTGNHTGDMTDNDTDDDASSTATITSITATTASGSAQTTFSSNSETVNGAYGTLTINSDGSYSYAANSNISGLDAGDANITDVFTYIVSDGTATDTATLTINVIASQDLTARNDTGTVNEDATLEVDDGDNANSITATATFVDSFSVSSQDTAPQDLAFNTDGTKMFVVGSAGDAVNEYTLSTGFDVSTATFVHSFSVSSLDTAPQGLAFNTDGTKMFVLGNSGIDVNEYTLSTGFDVSSATFVDSFSVSSQETNPLGLAFNTDGTKMFVSGTSGADVNEYTLSTGFDVSTATFVDSFSVSSQDLAPYGLAFNTDGTKMFVVGTIGDDVNEYTLSTGFDVSTASFVDSFSVSSQEAVPVGLAFNTDGTKMFVVGHEGDDVTEYSLTTPFSLVNVSGEHSGDVINTSSTDNYDTDPDDDTLTITSITATTAGGGAQTTFSSNTETVTGSYGTLTINSNGSYQYAATLDATDALDAGDVVTDVFTYIVSDGQGETDTATITITVIGVNDTPAADAETGSVDISHTLTVTDGTSDLLHGDTDADASASLSVSSIVATTASGSATAVNPGTAYNSGYTSVTGSYGALRVGADGTYQYIASSSSGTDVFTYTLSDGTATHDATLTITINNSAPTASNSTVYINENNQESTAGDRTPSNITKVFAASDFNFSDTDGGSLSKVKITTLESAGDLEYNNGSSWVDVTEDQEITASDISNNKLRFTPAANSESNPTFGFKVHDGTDYSSSAYTMTISVNAAPDVTNATVGSTVAAGATSSGDVHDGVADSDDDNSVLVVTGVASGNESSNNTIITNNTGVGSAVSGTYGSLNIAANGTYTYTASATNNIAYNSTAADTFTFTTRDDEGSAGSAGSHAYDVGTITFTVASSISLTNDDDTATEGTPITVTGAQDDVLNDDTADTDGLVVTNISHDNGSESVSSGTTYANGASLAGDYGTLVIGADGSYTFTPNDVLGASETGTDVFTYTADGATATLTITVTGINDDPVAVDDTGYIKEGGTLTVANSAAASSGTSTGNHTGDMTDNDTDDDASSTATITSITATTASGECTNNFFK